MKNNTRSDLVTAAIVAGPCDAGPGVADATSKPAPDCARSFELRPTWQVGARAAGKYDRQTVRAEPKAAGGQHDGWLDVNTGKTGELACKPL